MKLLFRLAAASLACIAAVWLLSHAAGWQAGPDRQRDVQAFRPAQPVILDESNLVDWLLSVPVSFDLERVDWSHRILAVDVRAELPVADPEAVYGELLEFAYHGIIGTRNVDRVWIRLVQSSRETGGGPDRLLIALDVKREQFLLSDYERWKRGELPAPMWIREKFEWSVTPQWRNAIGL